MKVDNSNVTVPPPGPPLQKTQCSSNFLSSLLNSPSCAIIPEGLSEKEQE